MNIYPKNLKVSILHEDVKYNATVAQITSTLISYFLNGNAFISSNDISIIIKGKEKVLDLIDQYYLTIIDQTLSSLITLYHKPESKYVNPRILRKLKHIMDAGSCYYD